MIGQGVSFEKVPFTVKDTHGHPYEALAAWAPAPRRRSLAQVPGGRRPVVAILDTGVSPHPWFDSSTDDDPVLIDAEDWGWPIDPPSRLAQPEHGTFVAGLIRQNAPDATILSVVLRRDADGGIATGQIREALRWVAGLRSPGRFADVICVAIGFRSITPDDTTYLGEVRAAIEAVGVRGSVVVAAAGNRNPGADDHIYPGALLADHSGEQLPLVAVGAVDADDAWADFSVTGEWVGRKYVGVDVLSTTPVQDGRRRFGRGSGTSYAAAGFAGRVAQAMLDDNAGVGDIEPAAAAERVRRALNTVGGRV